MRLESPMDKMLRKFRTSIALPYVNPESKICDVGCGLNPYFIKQLSKNLINKPVGIDKTIDSNLASGIELRQADFEHFLPVAENEFDVITMLAVIEHLYDYAKVIADCFRGLKSGGRIILTTPSPRSKPILELLANLKIISYFGIYDHKRYFKKSDLYDILQSAGFEKVKVWQVALGLNTVALGYKP